MIKKLCVAIIAMGMVGVVNAQEVKLGVKLGMNISSLNGNQDNLDPKDGWVLGATAEVALTEKFSLQPELLYSQQGAKSRGNFIYDLNYVTMPIMAKYYIADGFSLEAGPQLSFLVRDELLSDDDVNFGDLTVNPNSENLDVALNVGLGYRLNKRFSVQTRYSIGTMDVDESTGLKNGVFQMTVGYHFK